MIILLSARPRTQTSILGATYILGAIYPYNYYYICLPLSLEKVYINVVKLYNNNEKLYDPETRLILKLYILTRKTL